MLIKESRVKLCFGNYTKFLYCIVFCLMVWKNLNKNFIKIINSFKKVSNMFFKISVSKERLKAEYKLKFVFRALVLIVGQLEYYLNYHKLLAQKYLIAWKKKRLPQKLPLVIIRCSHHNFHVSTQNLKKNLVTSAGCLGFRKSSRGIRIAARKLSNALSVHLLRQTRGKSVVVIFKGIPRRHKPFIQSFNWRRRVKIKKIIFYYGFSHNGCRLKKRKRKKYKRKRDFPTPSKKFFVG